MTTMSIPMAPALLALQEACDALGSSPDAIAAQRWAVRQQMAGVRDALVTETGPAGEGWLTARTDTVLRERTVLLERLTALGPVVLQSDDVDAVRAELARLLADLGRHLQRLHDLAYDEVELELGGSE